MEKRRCPTVRKYMEYFSDEKTRRSVASVLRREVWLWEAGGGVVPPNTRNILNVLLDVAVWRGRESILAVIAIAEAARMMLDFCITPERLAAIVRSEERAS